jgi:hypothetical protein
MLILVSSASGTHGNGYGALLAFDLDGRILGPLSDDNRIDDPRGLAFDTTERLLFVNSGNNRVLALDPTGRVVRDTGAMAGLDPGGGTFGPDGRYYVGSRNLRTVLGFSPDLATPPGCVLPSRILPFPRGFSFGLDGRLFLASGIGPNGEGSNSIEAFALGEAVRHCPLVRDPELSPLDLLLGPNGNILASSEYPFGSPDASTTVREYDPLRGTLVRVLLPGNGVRFRKPRGLRVGREGHLYAVAEDEIVCFDLSTGKCLGALVQWPRLNGQAIEFIP